MEQIKLGGNIELNGFSSLDGGTMVILKKIIGNHTKNLFKVCNHFEKLSLTMNVPREIEKANDKSLFELKGTILDNEKEYEFKATASNVFVAVDSVLKNLESNFNEFKEDLKSTPEF